MVWYVCIINSLICCQRHIHIKNNASCDITLETLNIPNDIIFLIFMSVIKLKQRHNRRQPAVYNHNIVAWIKSNNGHTHAPKNPKNKCCNMTYFLLGQQKATNCMFSETRI